MTKQELKNKARELNGLATQRDIVQALNEVKNEELHEEEQGKTHILKRMTFTDAEWSELGDNLRDGGGVQDHRQPLNDGPSLRDLVWNAVFVDMDQVAFRTHAMSLLKSWIKQEGAVRRLPSGGVSTSGLSSQQRTPPVTETK